jgi:hypothetical protein
VISCFFQRFCAKLVPLNLYRLLSGGDLASLIERRAAAHEPFTVGGGLNCLGTQPLNLLKVLVSV